MSLEKSRLLGLDYGTRRIGAALSDPDKKVATPLAVIEFKSWATLALGMRRIIDDNAVSKIVVGYPKTLRLGKGGQSTRAVDKFCQWLSDQFGLPVIKADERFSSKLIRKAGIGRGKKPIDDKAAVVILQGYLDRPESEKEGNFQF